MKGFVYIHTNKVNGKKYVGQTTQRPEGRWGKDGNGYKKQPQFWNDIQKYGWDNFDHLAVEVPVGLLDFFEQSLIKQYDTDNPEHGYNKDSGGYKNKHFSDETRKKLSESHKGENHPFYGKHHSDETRKKMSESRKKPVVQYSKTGELINEYPSMQEAERYSGVSMGNISHCCNGERPSAGGFVWKHK